MKLLKILCNVNVNYEKQVTNTINKIREGFITFWVEGATVNSVALFQKI